MKACSPTCPEKLFWSLVILGILPPLYLALHNSLNYDVAWLVTAAGRLLEGGNIHADAFDVTPPLYLLFLMPPVALSDLTGLPVYYSAAIYPLFFILFSVIACRSILDKWDFLSRQDKDLFSAVYLLALFILPSADFGEKDHMILTGLMPFILLQLSLTLNYGIAPRLKWAVLVIGTFLILTKPHYGLLPTLLLLHRLVYSRSIMKILRSPDFLSLAAGTIGVLGILLAFFPIYLTEIVPDALALYAPARPPILAKTAFYAMSWVLIFAVLCSFTCPDEKKKNFILFLFSAALTGIALFYIQGKGYWYHLLPAQIFFFCALALYLQTLLSRFLPPLAPGFLVASAMTVLLYLSTPLNTKFPSHQEMKNLKLTKMVHDCPAPCSFFMFNDDVGMIHPTALYAGRTHASRFPALWFLPGILAGLENGAPQATAYKEKYAAMVAADFQRHRPALVILGQFKLNSAEEFDLPTFFSTNKDFAAAWAHYSFDQTVSVNNSDYYRGTALDDGEQIRFDIYRRKE